MPTDDQRKMTVDQVCAQTTTPRMTLSAQQTLLEVDRALPNALELDQARVRDQNRVLTSDLVRDLISSSHGDHARDAAPVPCRGDRRMVPNGGVSRVAKRLDYGAMAGGTLLATGQLSTVAPGLVVVVVGVLVSLTILLIIMLASLIIMLAGVAVFSSHPARRKTAERILSQLLSALTGTFQQ